MKTLFTSTIVALSIGLLFLIGPLASARGSGHGGGGGHSGLSGGGHAGFSASSHFSGGGRAYSGGGSYGGRHYSSGISASRYGNYGGSAQRYYAPRTSTGVQRYRSSVRSQSTTASRQFARSPRYSGSYYVPQDRSGTRFARKSAIQPRDYAATNRDIRQQRGGATARGATRPGNTSARQNLTNKQRLDPQTKERLHNWQGKAPGWQDAKHNNQEHWRDRHHHGHDWWHNHCDAIVLVNWGFWGWYDGWWYPAWGYDPYYSYYDYDGPIYGYNGLQPDEVIAGVQATLQQLGYYAYAVDGVLGPATETAIATYQRDNGLPVTGAIDPATVRSLGLSS